MSDSSRSERRRSRYHRRHRSPRGLRGRVRSGRGLYRDSRHKKICGVCAGVADYLDLERWQLRLAAALGLIFVPSAAITVYFIAYFLMDDKPYYRQVTDRYEDLEEDEDDVGEDTVTTAPRSGRQTAGMSSGQAMRLAKQKFADLEDRLRAMETHVTSSRFELQRELNEISGDDRDSAGGSAV